MTSRQGTWPATPLSDRIMADLIAHPDSTAGRIALRIEANEHIVRELLLGAMRKGLCTRVKVKTTWHWTATKAAEP